MMNNCMVLGEICSVKGSCISYPACKQCHGKVLQTAHQSTKWVCPKCNYNCNIGQLNYRYRICFTVTDGDTQCDVTVFGSNLDPFFGLTATQFHRFCDDCEPRLPLDLPLDHLIQLATDEVFTSRHFYFGFKTERFHKKDDSSPVPLSTILNIAKDKQYNFTGVRDNDSEIQGMVAWQMQPAAGDENSEQPLTVSKAMRCIVQRIIDAPPDVSTNTTNASVDLSSFMVSRENSQIDSSDLSLSTLDRSASNRNFQNETTHRTNSILNTDVTKLGSRSSRSIQFDEKQNNMTTPGASSSLIDISGSQSCATYPDLTHVSLSRGCNSRARDPGWRKVDFSFQLDPDSSQSQSPVVPSCKSARAPKTPRTKKKHSLFRAHISKLFDNALEKSKRSKRVHNNDNSVTHKSDSSDASNTRGSMEETLTSESGFSSNFESTSDDYTEEPANSEDMFGDMDNSSVEADSGLEVAESVVCAIDPSPTDVMSSGETTSQKTQEKTEIYLEHYKTATDVTMQQGLHSVNLLNTLRSTQMSVANFSLSQSQSQSQSQTSSAENEAVVIPINAKKTDTLLAPSVRASANDTNTTDSKQVSSSHSSDTDAFLACVSTPDFCKQEINECDTPISKLAKVNYQLSVKRPETTASFNNKNMKGMQMQSLYDHPVPVGVEDTEPVADVQVEELPYSEGLSVFLDDMDNNNEPPSDVSLNDSAFDLDKIARHERSPECPRQPSPQELTSTRGLSIVENLQTLSEEPSLLRLVSQNHVIAGDGCSQNGLTSTLVRESESTCTSQSEISDTDSILLQACEQYEMTPTRTNTTARCEKSGAATCDPCAGELTNKPKQSGSYYSQSNTEKASFHSNGSSGLGSSDESQSQEVIDDSVLGVDDSQLTDIESENNQILHDSLASSCDMFAGSQSMFDSDVEDFNPESPVPSSTPLRNVKFRRRNDSETITAIDMQMMNSPTPSAARKPRRSCLRKSAIMKLTAQNHSPAARRKSFPRATTNSSSISSGISSGTTSTRVTATSASVSSISKGMNHTTGSAASQDMFDDSCYDHSLADVSTDVRKENVNYDDSLVNARPKNRRSTPLRPIGNIMDALNGVKSECCVADCSDIVAATPSPALKALSKSTSIRYDTGKQNPALTWQPKRTLMDESDFINPENHDILSNSGSQSLFSDDSYTE